RAVLDCPGVIGREVIDHLPGLRDRGGGVLSRCRNAREKSDHAGSEKKPNLGAANATRSHSFSIAASGEDVVHGPTGATPPAGNRASSPPSFVIDYSAAVR